MGFKIFVFWKPKRTNNKNSNKIQKFVKKNFDTRKLILVTTVFYIDMRIYSIDRLLNGS